MNISLEDTINFMNSPSYKDRFLAEYLQLKIRLDKFIEMLYKWDSDELDFTPSCPRIVYEKQRDAMCDYLAVLLERARLENINLNLENSST